MSGNVKIRVSVDLQNTQPAEDCGVTTEASEDDSARATALRADSARQSIPVIPATHCCQARGSSNPAAPGATPAIDSTRSAPS